MADVPNLDLDAAADGTAQFAKAIEALTAADKAAQDAAEAATAAAAKRADEVKRLKGLYGDYAAQVEKAAQRNKELAAAMADGSFARQAREMAVLTREYERMRREAELVARYGERAGAFLARYGGALNAAGRLGADTVGTGVGQARALAARGMGGTVEQARMDYALDQLSRQFAAVMTPLTQSMTYLAGQLERRMRGMDGSEQNRLLVGIVGAGVGLRYGGILGGVAGGAAGAGLMGGGSSTTAMLGMTAGAALGYRYGGPVGAVAGGSVGLVAGTSRSFAGESGTEYYNRMRRPVAEGGGGATVLGAYLSGMGESARRLFENPLPGRPPTGRAGEPRRDVTPFQAQMGEAGSTAFRIQEAMIRATAGAGYEDDGGPFKPVIDVLLKILDVLLGMSGSPPLSATAARG